MEVLAQAGRLKNLSYRGQISARVETWVLAGAVMKYSTKQNFNCVNGRIMLKPSIVKIAIASSHLG